MQWCKVSENATLSGIEAVQLNPDQTLTRLGWLRLSVAVVWVTLLLWLVYAGFALPLPVWWILSGYIPLIALPFWQARRQMQQDALLLNLLAETQLMTALLFFSGGATNPVISYFLVLMVVAAYSLSRYRALLVAAALILDYSALTQWYMPLARESLAGQSTLFTWHVGGMWLTFVISTLIIAGFLPALVRDRQIRQREIQALRERQLKNEQLIGIATLAAGTAHEMGTPLMTLTMLLDEAEEDKALDDGALGLMRAQVDRCRHSLQQLAMAGRQANSHGVHDAEDWLRKQLHRWRLSKPHALWDQLDCDASCDVPASPLLDQALLNLLDNAAEAGKQPIRLTTRVTDNCWELEIVQPDPAAAASIRNDALFASAKEHGMGIGLYLSNASIEQFGGSIHIHALPAGGSLCHLKLPRDTRKSAR